MLRPRWRKVIHDLWDNKLRTILVVLSIAVGVFAVGAIAGTYVIISNDLSVSYASANPANIVFYTMDFNDDLSTAIQNLSDVKDVEPRRGFNVRIRKVSHNPDIPGDRDWTNIDLIASSDFSKSNVNLLKPITGQSLPSDRELVLDKKVLNDIDIVVGDILEVQLQDGTIRQMPVVGIVQDLTTGAGDFLSSPLGFIAFDSLNWLRQPQLYNRMLVTVNGDSNNEDHIRQVSKTVSDKVESAGNVIARTRISKTNDHPLSSTLNAVLGILMALGILIVLLSSSLIANTLNSLLTQHQRFIGVMKLVGARSSQITGMYILLILMFSFLALILAVPLGGQAAYALSSFVAENLNFSLLGYRVVPLAIVLQIIIALVVPLLAGLVPVIKGSHTTVQRAISGYDSNQAKLNQGLINRGLEKIRFLSRPLLISLRNTFRRRGRLILTLVTLTMGGAIFIAVFNVQASLEHYIGDIGRYFLADVTLNFTEPYRISEIQNEAQRVTGIKNVEGWAFVSADALRSDGSVADTIQVLAPPADSPLVQPMLLQGRWIIPGDEKAVTISESVLKSFPELKAGDYIRLKVNGREDDWKIVGIFKFVDIDNLLAYASYDYIANLMNMANRSFSYRVDGGCEDLTCQRELANRIDQHFRQAGYHVNEVEAGQMTLKTASESLNILVTFLLIMALLTASVGSIGLAGTMGMNVMERTREIGIMRSIGAVDWAVINSVLLEGLFIGIISWFLAILVSFPISYLLSTIISLAIFNTPIDLVFTWQGFAIWLALVLFLSAIASILPARNASRLTIREILAYE